MAQGAGYSFNTNTVVGSTVQDQAGYFLDGTIVGSAAITTGKYGNGLNCTGGAMHIGPVDQFDYPTNTDGGLSLSAWVKLNTTTAAVRCIASASVASTLKWALYASNATGNVEAQVAGVTFSTTTSIRDSTFHHVMLVLDAVPATDTVKIYVDGTLVLSTTTATALVYGGNVGVDVGRNVVSTTEALDGVVDDFRWWNDPVDSGSIGSVVSNEQVDAQLAVYPFNDDTVNDFSIYSRHLVKSAAGSYTTGLYGRALKGDGTAASASASINLPDCDRLAITGWLRLDATPVSAAPIMAITTAAGASKLRVVVNPDRTLTATWVTVYGTYAVSSTTVATVGQWAQFQIAMNPTYVNMRLISGTHTITNTTNPTPVLAPTVLDMNKFYIGGDAAGGAQITFDYVQLTKNFVNAPTVLYWTGPVNRSAQKPANLPRGIYDMNANAGTTALDKSTYANTLTLQTAGSWVSGIQGSALGATGVGPGGQKTALNWSASPPGWAFSAWVKTRASSTGARFLVLRGVPGEVAHAGTLSGLFWVRLYGSGGTTGIISQSVAPIPSETWTHVAASCNGNTIEFFLNGKWVASSTYTVGTLLQPNELNVGGDTGTDQSVADVDDLMTFDTPIARPDIAWMYANPGMLAAGTPVAASRATTWKTAATITSSRSTTWKALARFTLARSTTWNVIAAASKVNAFRATTWNVLSTITSVSASRATTWRTLTQTTASRATSWLVDGPVVVPKFKVKFPTYKMPMGWTKPLIWQTYDAPYALVKVNGEWILTAVPSQELLRIAERFYLGGYYYELTAGEAADLPPQYVEAIP